MTTKTVCDACDKELVGDIAFEVRTPDAIRDFDSIYCLEVWVRRLIIASKDPFDGFKVLEREKEPAKAWEGNPPVEVHLKESAQISRNL